MFTREKRHHSHFSTRSTHGRTPSLRIHSSSPATHSALIQLERRKRKTLALGISTWSTSGYASPIGPPPAPLPQLCCWPLGAALGCLRPTQLLPGSDDHADLRLLARCRCPHGALSQTRPRALWYDTEATLVLRHKAHGATPETAPLSEARRSRLGASAPVAARPPLARRAAASVAPPLRNRRRASLKCQLTSHLIQLYLST